MIQFLSRPSGRFESFVGGIILCVCALHAESKHDVRVSLIIMRVLTA